MAIIPAWVVAPHRQVVDLNYMTYVLATEIESVHGQGQLAAVGWVTGQCAAPVTHRAEPVTFKLARAESWAALCVAANDSAPTTRDWERLAVRPAATVSVDADFAHGAWRTFAWLLGVRPDPPIELPVRDADGSIPPWERHYAYRGDPTQPEWQAADQRRRERNRAEALQYWRHIRRQLELSEQTAANVGDL